jgi:RsiW-degrading membrane proteinase PrsW (M82 family)
LLALFTGTVGIALLLGFQIIAEATQGHVIIARNPIIMLLFWIAWLIGFSYRAALDPQSNFFMSLLGFTLGVGLCEEVCKALPLVWHYRRTATLDWRGAFVWGLASGVGFGVAEGIMYAGDFYNGVADGMTYVVRFVSCVALHAIWTASAGLFIWRHQGLLQGEFRWYDYIPRVFLMVLIPMVLHGLYDTFLKKEYDALALVIALASFGWLAWQIETARRQESDEETARLHRELQSQRSKGRLRYS